MTRRRAVLLAVALLALAAAVVFGPTYQTRALVRWHANRLRSSNPNERAAARAALLALGRPTIDAVYPDLVAQEVDEEATGTPALVLVGRRRALTAEETAHVGSAEHLRGYEVEEALRGPAPAKALLASGPLVCPTAQKLWSDSASVELVVVAPRLDGSFDLRLAVPLDDRDRATVLPAVRARLSLPR